MSLPQIAKTVVIPYSNGVESMALIAWARLQGVERILPLVFESDRTEYANRRASMIAALIDLGLYADTYFMSMPDTDVLQAPDGSIPGYKWMMMIAALSYAAAKGAGMVFFGHNKENQSQPYLDQSGEAFAHTQINFNRLYGTKIQLLNPFSELTKTEVIKLYPDMPYHKSVSCDSLVLTGLLHCGTCSSCVERRAAFQRAQLDTLYSPARRTAPLDRTAYVV